MNVLILYFSGTGNTYFIANKIYNWLNKEGYNIKMQSFENFQLKDIEETDILIFAYPIYACGIPDFIENHLQQLNTVQNKGVIVYCTMGLYAGNSLKKVIKFFSKKGFKSIDYKEIKMPGSDGLVFMKKDSKYVKNVLSTDYHQSSEVNGAINNIINKVDEANLIGVDNLPEKIPGLKISRMIIGGLVKFVYRFMENRLKKKFWVDKSCIKCGLCEDNCPAKNIIIREDKIEFLDRCYLCMRCINQCPVEAIQIGKKTKGKFRYKGPIGNYKPGKNSQ